MGHRLAWNLEFGSHPFCVALHQLVVVSKDQVKTVRDPELQIVTGKIPGALADSPAHELDRLIVGKRQFHQCWLGPVHHIEAGIDGEYVEIRQLVEMNPVALPMESTLAIGRDGIIRENSGGIVLDVGSFLIRQFAENLGRAELPSVNLQDFGVHPSAELKWFGPVVKGAAHAECIRSHMGYAVQGVYRSNVDERRTVTWTSWAAPYLDFRVTGWAS